MPITISDHLAGLQTATDIEQPPYEYFQTSDCHETRYKPHLERGRTILGIKIFCSLFTTCESNVKWATHHAMKEMKKWRYNSAQLKPQRYERAQCHSLPLYSCDPLGGRLIGSPRAELNVVETRKTFSPVWNRIWSLYRLGYPSDRTTTCMGQRKSTL